MASGTPSDRQQQPHDALTARESAVYAVLEAHAGRVVGRHEIARGAALTGLSERRCDSLISNIRKVIGPDQITTVRRRGWILTTVETPVHEPVTQKKHCSDKHETDVP